ncbi:MAG TPA: site-2 protease family protein [Syntrophomonas sp.]|jgi:Zn-dependent protease|nr:site-2 protease family protein [Syntrophomonas sp.]
MNSLVDLIIYLPAILIAITFHEYAHGRVAYALGDDTPRLQGRLTVNPLPHIDWIGFAMLFIFHFGWAKPVQVNPYNFKHISIKQGMMLVSLAGPGMNLLLAFLALILMRILIPFQSSETVVISLQLLQPLVSINIILAAFNLIPLPPLDGSKILAGILPDSGARLMYGLEQYGFVILMLLIITGMASKIFMPIANFLYKLLASMVIF